MGIKVVERRRLQLRLRMRQKGLNYMDVAAVMGVQPQTVRAYMCGARRIPAENYEKLLAYLRSPPAIAA